MVLAIFSKKMAGFDPNKPKCAISSGCASSYCTFVLAPTEGLLAVLTRMLAEVVFHFTKFRLLIVNI